MSDRPRPVPRSGAAGAYKVIHLLKHCERGNGHVHVAVDLACLQADAGHQVTYASEGGTFAGLLEQHGVRILALVQDQRRPFETLRALMRLIALCRKERPHILHAHMMVGAGLGWIAARLSGAKLVTTVHNSFDRHSALMRLGDAVVAVSEAEREQLIKRGFDESRLVSIWNAPDQSPREAFMQNDHEIHLANPCVLAVSGLHRRKGVFDLITAFAPLAAEFPDWTLYIAGDGPDRQALENNVQALGMGGRIVFLGYVPAPKPLFNQADIYVLPSYADPGSLTICEARMAGCAIIATAVGGTPEMLGYGEAGRLVAPGAPKQLAVELRRLMAGPQDRAILRAAARAGSDVFAVSRLIADYDRAYRRAMQPTSTEPCGTKGL